jgi:hypothetical protein
MLTRFGRIATLNVAAYYASVNSIEPGQRAYEQLIDVPADLYGSEG